MKKLNNAVDSPAMVQYCLQCTMPECQNCLGQKSAYAKALRRELKGKEKK